jgi:hypothetical protein
MKRNRNSTGLSADPITITAERTRMMHELLPKLALAVAANEKTQHKFTAAVLIRLAKIETVVTDILGAQLAKNSEAWPLNRLNEEQLDKYFQDVEERISRCSEALGLKMVRYIYGENERPEGRHDRRRKWWGWEI